MTLADLQMIRQQYAEVEHRDPTITEIRLFDTYWSDHCRHTTFMTELTDITIEDSRFTGYTTIIRNKTRIFQPRSTTHVTNLTTGIIYTCYRGNHLRAL